MHTLGPVILCLALMACSTEPTPEVLVAADDPSECIAPARFPAYEEIRTPVEGSDDCEVDRRFVGCVYDVCVEQAVCNLEFFHTVCGQRVDGAVLCGGTSAAGYAARGDMLWVEHLISTGELEQVDELGDDLMPCWTVLSRPR